MATYVPNANQTTEPVESQTVESAALEFRTLKKHALQYLTADADTSKTALPAATARAGKFLAFDSITGEPVIGPDIADWTITQSQIAAVETVAADLNEPVSEIETVAASIANVDLVGSSISSVNTVAPSIEDVVVVADNIAAVNNLSDAVTNGDLLTGVYQGAYAANPIKRLDNSALQNGDIYFNTATTRMMAYASGTWYATETMGATDSALVTHTPAGTSPTPTTVHQKLLDLSASIEFADMQAFRADTSLTYSNGIVAAGDKIRIKREGAILEIAASDAVDYEEANIGGLRVYITAWAKNTGTLGRGRNLQPAVVDTAHLTHLNSNWPGLVTGEWEVTGTAGSATLAYVGGTAIASLTQGNFDGSFPVAFVSTDLAQMFCAIVTGNDGATEIYLREPLEEDFAGSITSWGDAPNGQHLTYNATRVLAKTIAEATEFESCQGASFGLIPTLFKKAAAQWEANTLYAAAAANDGGVYPDRVDKHPFATFNASSPFLIGNMVANIAGGQWMSKCRTQEAGHRSIGMWLTGHGVKFRCNARGANAFLQGWVSGAHSTRNLNTYYSPASVEIEIKVTQNGKVIYQKTQNHSLRSHRLKMRSAGDVLVEITLLGNTPVYVYLGDWSIREAGQGGALIEPGDRVLIGMDSWGAYYGTSVVNGMGTLLRRGLISKELERMTGCHCVDKSAGGKTGAWVLAWLEIWIKRYKPDVFITNMAINDNTLESLSTTTDTPDGLPIPAHIAHGYIEESKSNALGSGLIQTLLSDNMQRMADICQKYGVRLVYMRVGAVPSAGQTQLLAVGAPYIDFRAIMADGATVPAADITNAHSVVNGNGKFPGMRVWNRDAAAVYVARGPNPLDAWFKQDAPATLLTPTDVLAPVFLNRNAQNVAVGVAMTFALRCDEPVTYTITGGADMGLFSLGTKLDSETQMLGLPGQVAGSYVVQVTATDIGSNATVQTITITVS